MPLDEFRKRSNEKEPDKNLPKAELVSSASQKAIPILEVSSVLSPNEFYTVVSKPEKPGKYPVPAHQTIEPKDSSYAVFSMVKQGKFISVKISDREYRPLYTCGLGPCVAIGLFNPETNLACLSHMDSETKVDIMIDTMKESVGLEKDAPSLKLKSFLAGGNDNSGNEISILAKSILNTPESNVVSTYSKSKYYSSDSKLGGECIDVLFDPKKGEIAYIIIGTNTIARTIKL